MKPKIIMLYSRLFNFDLRNEFAVIFLKKNFKLAVSRISVSQFRKDVAYKFLYFKSRHLETNFYNLHKVKFSLFCLTRKQKANFIPSWAMGRQPVPCSQNLVVRYALLPLAEFNKVMLCADNPPPPIHMNIPFS